MPNNNQSTRTIKGDLPARTGTYAPTTARLVQGKSSNKTAQYLADLRPDDPGLQGFYRAALMVPNPLEADKQLSYGQLQQLLDSPQKVAALEAYAQQNRLDRAPTAEAYAQTMFDQGRADLLRRGAANPGVLAFPAAADSARRAPNTAVAIARGNFVQPEGNEATNAAMQAQRFANAPASQTAYAAPGMSGARLVRGAAPAPAPRIIRSTIGNSIAAR